MRITKLFCVTAIVLLAFTGCRQPKVEEDGFESKPEIESKQTEIEREKNETSEEKAVRLAEEFIKRNGYTDAPADRDGLKHETVEFYNSLDDLLEQRKNTLEAKAYGVSRHGRGNGKGWTVVFRFSEEFIKKIEKQPKISFSDKIRLAGRAVTMNEKFENLLVEHKDFPLENIEKKLQ